MDRRAIVFLKHKHSKGFEYAPNIVGIERQGNIYRIDFGNSKSYNYSAQNVRYYKLKQTHRRVRLYDNGQLRGRYDELDDYGDYLIGYHSDTQTDPMRKHEGLVLCPINSDRDQAQRLLAYYKTILEQGIEVSRDMPNDEAPLPEKDKQSIRDIQLSALERIDLHESQSVCSYYMEGTIPPPTPLTEPIIYPFGCNESQKLAVETALSHAVSVIEGPPGTGKTQTILNIIANLVVQGKTVAVVSNNNAAVFNVRDKLTKYGYGGLVASLGNKENRAAFFNSLPKVTLSESARLAKEDLHAERAEVGRVAALLSQSFGIRSSLAKLKTQLLEAEIEQQHLLEEQPLEARVQMELDAKFLRKLDYQRILSLKDLLEDMMRGGGKIPWLGRLRLMLSFGLLDQRILGRYRDELLVYANHKFYELYIAHLKVEIASKEAWLVDHDEDKLLKDLTERSRKVFEAMLLERKTDTDEAFTLEKYKQEFDSFVRHYPIVISSTLSLPMSIPRGYLFDYLIIDEASQVDSIKGAISFACSKRAVIVGDSMQLAHIVDSRSQAVAGEAFAACTLPEPYDYVRHSILSSLKSLLGVRLQCTLLKEHYRCHPAIIGFCNKKYYDGQLVVMTEGGGSPFKIIERGIAI
ncbi:MAG: AAA domain-containing protein [Porphyromonadaceae bacterium]|nr:AAA domain-containing protein [Porphyromonadaceae bacterium]